MPLLIFFIIASLGFGIAAAASGNAFGALLLGIFVGLLITFAVVPPKVGRA